MTSSNSSFAAATPDQLTITAISLDNTNALTLLGLDPTGSSRTR